MKATEKITSLYLRLNGFFLMPHFTVFARGRGRHTDILGIRPGNSKETVGEHALNTDIEFIRKLGGPNEDIKLWAEVGTKSLTNINELFPKEKAEYVEEIFGKEGPIRKAYFDFRDKNELRFNVGSLLVVTMPRCRDFILGRFDQMQSEEMTRALKRISGLTKEGSWSWSEDFLADLLFLRRAGFLRER